MLLLGVYVDFLTLRKQAVREGKRLDGDGDLQEERGSGFPFGTLPSSFSDHELRLIQLPPSLPNLLHQAFISQYIQNA